MSLWSWITGCAEDQPYPAQPINGYPHSSSSAAPSLASDQQGSDSFFTSGLNSLANTLVSNRLALNVAKRLISSNFEFAQSNQANQKTLQDLTGSPHFSGVLKGAAPKLTEQILPLLTAENIEKGTGLPKPASQELSKQLKEESTFLNQTVEALLLKGGANLARHTQKNGKDLDQFPNFTDAMAATVLTMVDRHFQTIAAELPKIDQIEDKAEREEKVRKLFDPFRDELFHVLFPNGAEDLKGDRPLEPSSPVDASDPGNFLSGINLDISLSPQDIAAGYVEKAAQYVRQELFNKMKESLSGEMLLKAYHQMHDPQAGSAKQLNGLPKGEKLTELAEYTAASIVERSPQAVADYQDEIGQKAGKLFAASPEMQVWIGSWIGNRSKEIFMSDRPEFEPMKTYARNNIAALVMELFLNIPGLKDAPDPMQFLVDKMETRVSRFYAENQDEIFDKLRRYQVQPEGAMRDAAKKELAVLLKPLVEGIFEEANLYNHSKFGALLKSSQIEEQAAEILIDRYAAAAKPHRIAESREKLMKMPGGPECAAMANRLTKRVEKQIPGMLNKSADAIGKKAAASSRSEALEPLFAGVISQALKKITSNDGAPAAKFWPFAMEMVEGHLIDVLVNIPGIEKSENAPAYIAAKVFEATTEFYKTRHAAIDKHYSEYAALPPGEEKDLAKQKLVRLFTPLAHNLILKLGVDQHPVLGPIAVRNKEVIAELLVDQFDALAAAPSSEPVLSQVRDRETLEKIADFGTKKITDQVSVMLEKNGEEISEKAGKAVPGLEPVAASLVRQMKDPSDPMAQMAHRALQKHIRAALIQWMGTVPGIKESDNALSAVALFLTSETEAYFASNHGELNRMLNVYNRLPASETALKEQYKKQIIEKFKPLAHDLLSKTDIGSHPLIGSFSDYAEEALAAQLADLYVDIESPLLTVPAYKEKLAHLFNKPGTTQGGEEVAKLVEDTVAAVSGSAGNLAKKTAASHANGIAEAISEKTTGGAVPADKLADAIRAVTGSDNNGFAHLNRHAEALLLKVVVNVLSSTPLPEGAASDKNPKEGLPEALIVRFSKLYSENLGEATRHEIDRVCNELEAIESDGKEKEAKRAELNLLFRPMAEALYALSNDAGTGEEIDLPIPSSSKDQVKTYLKQQMLPELLAGVYLQSTKLRRKNGEMKEELASLPGKKAENREVFCKEVAAYVSKFIPSHMAVESDRVAEKLYPVFAAMASADPKVADYFEQNRDTVLAFLRDRIHEIGTSEEIEQQGVWEFVREYLEPVVVKSLLGVMKEIHGLEQGNPEFKVRLIGALFGVVTDHLTTHNAIVRELGVDTGYRVGDKAMLAKYKEKGQLHPGVPSSPGISKAGKDHIREAYYKQFGERLIDLAGFDELPLPDALRKQAMDLVKDEILPSDILLPLMEKLIAPEGKTKLLLGILKRVTAPGDAQVDQTPDELDKVYDEMTREFIGMLPPDGEKFKKSTRQWMQALLSADNHKELEKVNNAYLSNLRRSYSNGNDRLAAVKKAKAFRQMVMEMRGAREEQYGEMKQRYINQGIFTPDEIQLIYPKLQEAQHHANLNRKCGKLLLQLVDMIPQAMSKTFLENFDELHQLSSEAVGRAVRRYFREHSLLEVVDEGIESGIGAIREEEFPKTREEADALKEKERKQAESRKREFTHTWVEGLGNQIFKTAEQIAMGWIDRVTAKLKSWFEPILGEKNWNRLSSAVGGFIQHWVWPAVKFILYPFYLGAIRIFKEIYLARQPKKVLRNADMAHHESMFYNLFDEFLKQRDKERALKSAATAA